MRELNPDDIDQLIALPGMVIRVSPIIPDMKEAFFKCTVCNHTTTVEIENGFIAEPTACNSCSTQKSYELVHNRCRFTDKQMIKLQETPEMIPDGATPQTALIYCYDELVDTVQPGDRVEVTGIYRATPLRVMARQRTVKSIYKTHLDALHFNKSTGNRVRREGAEDEEEVSVQSIT
jgi:DNA replication licensing factor MCM4